MYHFASHNVGSLNPLDNPQGLTPTNRGNQMQTDEYTMLATQRENFLFGAAAGFTAGAAVTWLIKRR